MLCKPNSAENPKAFVHFADEKECASLHIVAAPRFAEAGARKLQPAEVAEMEKRERAADPWTVQSAV